MDAFSFPISSITAPSTWGDWTALVCAIIAVAGITVGPILHWLRGLKQELENVKDRVSEQGITLETLQRDVKSVFKRQDADRVEHNEMFEKIAKLDSKLGSVDSKIDTILEFMPRPDKHNRQLPGEHE